jgi:hypothetical protein
MEYADGAFCGYGDDSVGAEGGNADPGSADGVE